MEDRVAMYDQIEAEVQHHARVVASYHRKLREHRVGEYEALRLTLAFQRRLAFPNQEADPMDSDSD